MNRRIRNNIIFNFLTHFPSRISRLNSEYMWGNVTGVITIIIYGNI